MRLLTSSMPSLSLRDDGRWAQRAFVKILRLSQAPSCACSPSLLTILHWGQPPQASTLPQRGLFPGRSLADKLQCEYPLPSSRTRSTGSVRSSPEAAGPFSRLRELWGLLVLPHQGFLKLDYQQQDGAQKDSAGMVPPRTLWLHLRRELIMRLP